MCKMLPMTVARSQLIDRVNGGFHHVVSRCVRRSWLCGKDSHSGCDFSHRKGWIEEWMLTLTKAFAVRVYGYAVMSNHCHIALEVRPKEVLGLSAEEVARRWLIAHPPSTGVALELRVQALASNAEKIEVLRDRLGDLSWFMRCLNWRIAVRANREDGCTGRFWEGRFHSGKPLPNLKSLYACMTYVDLNPLRAGATNSVAKIGERTGLRRRVEESEVDDRKLRDALAPLRIDRAEGRIYSGGPTSLELTLGQYLAHVQWTARQEIADREGLIKHSELAPNTLSDPEGFLALVRKFHKRWGRKEGRGDAPLPGHVRPGQEGSLATS